MVENPFKIACDSEGNPITYPGRLLNTALKNGSESNFAVDGSGTAQDFLISPPSTYSVLVGMLSICVQTSNTLAIGNRFIVNTISTLTNGLLLRIRSQNVEYTFANFQRTFDLLKLGKGSPDMISGATSYFRVNLWLPKGILLAKDGTFGTDDDFVAVRVRDDLRDLDYAEIVLQGVEVP